MPAETSLYQRAISAWRDLWSMTVLLHFYLWKLAEKQALNFRSKKPGFIAAPSNSGFLSLSLIDIWCHMTLGWGREERCPVHCRVFSSISSLHPLDPSNISPGRDNQKYLHTLLNVSCGLRTTNPTLSYGNWDELGNPCGGSSPCL